jgi:hypothetical protein
MAFWASALAKHAQAAIFFIALIRRNASLGTLEATCWAKVKTTVAKVSWPCLQSCCKFRIAKLSLHAAPTRLEWTVASWTQTRSRALIAHQVKPGLLAGPGKSADNR